jgi:hypothetical protein
MGALACKTKIILDGGRAAGLAQSISDATRGLSEDQTVLLTDPVAYPIIKNIISAESALEAAHNLLLDAMGYKGPRP